MKLQNNQRKRGTGFTLIEVTAVLVLSGIAAIVAAMLIETMFKVSIGNYSAVSDSQKIQVAMNRLVKELTYAEAGSVILTNSRTIQWKSDHPDRLDETTTVTWDGQTGSNLNFTKAGFQPAVLLGKVGGFTVSKTAESITLTMQSERSMGVAHTMTIHPRYNP